MINGRKVYAVVPMREGSTRLKDKNISIFAGKPLALITLNKIWMCKYIDKIFVSTSSPRYQAIVEGWGYDVIDRPENLSGDHAPLLSVTKHAAKQFINLSSEDFVVEFTPCAPLCRTFAFDYLIKYAAEHNLDSCFAVQVCDYSFVDDPPTRSQDQKKRYRHMNYCRLRTKETALTSEGWGTGKNHANLPVIDPFNIDIDDDWGWIASEALYDRVENLKIEIGEKK